MFYSWGQTQNGNVYDPDFKQAFSWDIPLLEGYDYVFIENIAKKPGAGHFTGIKNRDLLPALAAWKPDALLVYGWSFQSHLQVLRHYHGRVKILFRGDSTLLDEAAGLSVRKLLRRLLLRWVYRYTDIALYPGQANKAYYTTHGVRENQLCFAPHAVENERFAEPAALYEQKASAWRTDLGIPADALVFLFAGKFEAKKDPLLLLRAFCELQEPNVRLILAGTGDLRDEIQKVASKDSRVHVLGFQNQQQMPILYRLCNVFILPSKGPGETWGLAVNEAMACGRAVIVSNRCGCAQDLVRDNGFIFEAGNKEALLERLSLFVNDFTIAKKMGDRSRHMIRFFSLEHVAKAIEEQV